MKYISKKDLVFSRRSAKSHKGQNGRLLVIGGSSEYTGAVALAGMAAYRTGCDWVTIAVPEKVGVAVSSIYPELVVKKYKGDDFCASRAKDILKFEKGFDAVLIGNGIGMHAKTFCKKFVSESSKPLVIDADAIKSIRLQDVNNAILTPHKGEFKMLLTNSKISEKDLKKHIRNNVIILKGAVDQIITKDKILYNKTGNAGMTKAGTGDVLAGICAGYLSQGLSPLQAAINSTFINGFIGDKLLKERKGCYSFVASDIIDDLNKVERVFE